MRFLRKHQKRGYTYEDAHETYDRQDTLLHDRASF